MNVNILNRNPPASNPMEAHITCRRRALTSAIASLLLEMGIDCAEKQVMESLTELLQSLLFEIGNSSRAYCEHAGRTEPVVGDVVIALVNLGLSTDGLEAHAKRPGRTVVSAPAQSSQPKQPSILQAGVKQSPPSHIPPHLPAFPDPHAYIRTPTHKQPVTEYEAIREKAAQQKRDVERALTRFIARTGDTHSLFPNNDSNMFPLIACKPQHPPYLKALLPLDQVFDFEEEIGPQNIPAAAGKPGDSATNIKGEQPSPNRPRQKTKQNTQTDHEDADEDGATVKEQPSEEAKTETDIIDNPYLRPVKMPRKKIKKKLFVGLPF